jgi:antitoxin component of MazEF toxin-antitoxin module
MSVEIKAIGGSLMVLIPAEMAREMALKKGQRLDVALVNGELVLKPAAKPDWASFFAQDFGIPSDFVLEREQFQDRDVFGLNAPRRTRKSRRVSK